MLTIWSLELMKYMQAWLNLGIVMLGSCFTSPLRLYSRAIELPLLLLYVPVTTTVSSNSILQAPLNDKINILSISDDTVVRRFEIHGKW